MLTVDVYVITGGLKVSRLLHGFLSVKDIGTHHKLINHKVQEQRDDMQTYGSHC